MKFLTTDEVAEMLRFGSKDSIHQMLHSGTLPKELKELLKNINKGYLISLT